MEIEPRRSCALRSNQRINSCWHHYIKRTKLTILNTMQPSKIPLQNFLQEKNNNKHSNRKGKMKKEERKQTKQILTVNSHHRKSWVACKRCGLKLIRMRSVSISIVYFAHTIPLQPRLSCCLLDTRLSVTIA